ncbi:MAG: dTDP-4-dehydrorhamnose 3,5-epimerase [Deltaproteobacteria bacterium]|nr:dTDP-4-dehydrorhamnose 3,5-epimerase [Deltaproteobacteria bacterium]
MKITPTELPEVLLIEPKVFGDARGVFFESFRANVFAEAGMPVFVQENQSSSVPGTLRGLHYQLDMPQAKLVRAVKGRVFDVAVDIRRGSPTFGRWVGRELSEENKHMLFVPVGFAHGFCVIGHEPAEVFYKCSDYYSGAADQRGMAWNDAGVGVPWPVKQPLLSEKDQTYKGLSLDRDDLPKYVPGLK